MIRIHIQQLNILKIHADPVPQPWFPHTTKCVLPYLEQGAQSIYLSKILVKNIFILIWYVYL
jgi:hypothetical protein